LYGGQWRDAALAFLWGLVVYIVEALGNRLRGLTSIVNFITCFLIALGASILDRFVFGENSCLFAQMFGGTVWLLPGVTISVALQELYSNMIVYGSSRLMFGVSQALQMGFGFALGYKAVFFDRSLPPSFKQGCPDSSEIMTDHWTYVLLPICIISFAIIGNAPADKWIGILICSFAAYFINSVIGRDAGTLLAALGLGLLARIYGRLRGQQPVIFMISGTLVLVPGGLAVRGLASLISADAISGLSFTGNMLVVGCCIALGLFLAQLPRKHWLITQMPPPPNSPEKEEDDEQYYVNFL
jgi:uncharacterized membrane protein YjjB (DUF3815 family)